MLIPKNVFQFFKKEIYTISFVNLLCNPYSSFTKSILLHNKLELHNIQQFSDDMTLKKQPVDNQLFCKSK